MPPPVPARWIQNKSDELAIAEGCWFDTAAGERVCRFMETQCKLSDAGGAPMVLLEWEYDATMRLFGWKRPDGRRRFETCYIEIAKKNGKSTWVAAIENALLTIDGEPRPEIYINACDRGQASIIFDESARMVKASPALSRRLKVIDYRKRIVYPANNGVIRANSADAPNKDGLNPSAVLWDELHRQPDFQLWDVFKYASAARRQPLRIAITTAGEDDTGPWFEQREYSEKVNAGVLPVTTHLGIVYRCDPEDDLDDENVWRKANPALGETIQVEKFKAEWEEAKANPRETPGFLRLRFNIITKSDSVFIPVEEWDANNGATDPDAFLDVTGWGGFDLAKKIDLCSFVAIVGSQAKGFDVIAKFWRPADDIAAAEKRDRVTYQVWAKQGWLRLTPGATTDYAYIRHDINALVGRKWVKESHRFEADPDAKTRIKFESIKGDDWNANQLITELIEQDGLPVQAISQTVKCLSDPTTELEKLVKERKIRHSANPVLRWCISNAVAYTDVSGNVRLDKKRSRNKIDGAAALVNALAGVVVPGDAEPTHSAADLYFF